MRTQTTTQPTPIAAGEAVILTRFASRARKVARKVASRTFIFAC